MTFSGDFRQTLPVIVGGTRADIIKSCLKSSPLWKSVEFLKLSTNMRSYHSGGTSEFENKLLLIGEGKVPESGDKKFSLDKDLGRIVTNIEDLILKVYPNVANIHQKNHQWMCERAILRKIQTLTPSMKK